MEKDHDRTEISAGRRRRPHVQIEAVLALHLRGLEVFPLVEPARDWAWLRTDRREAVRLPRSLPRRNRLGWTPSQRSYRRSGIRYSFETAHEPVPAGEPGQRTGSHGDLQFISSDRHGGESQQGSQHNSDHTHRTSPFFQTLSPGKHRGKGIHNDAFGYLHKAGQSAVDRVL